MNTEPCPAEDVFVDWLDKRLAADRMKALDAHLDACGACRQLFAELSRLQQTKQERTPPRQADLLAANAPPAIGRFVIEKLLGEGGMGTVFLARDPDLDRRVAIKVLKAGMPDARLAEEARSQAQLSHPNVVRVYEVGAGATGLYIAMELVEGETLREWLKRHPPWPDVVAAFDAAGRGLAAAHRAGLVHRDFKPANVLVGGDGRIAVTDFGLARSDQRPSGRRARAPTDAGMVAGTPGYLAPEQYRGERATELSDQFAFAVSLYEGLYGGRPFQGVDEIAIMDNILAGRVRPPPGGTEVPPWLHDIVLRGIALDPAARFPAMTDLLSAIDERLERGTRRRDCPFPGLAAYDVTDSDIYFGRDAEIAEAARRISDSGFLAVVGPSGSGKSSFVRAGVIPALRAQSRIVELLIRPGPKPVQALLKLQRELAPDEAHDLSRLGEVLANHATQTQSRVVLVIDQLEELFTLTHDDREQAQFIEALDAIADRHSDRVRCIVTLRSDMLEQAQRYKPFLRRLVANLLFLPNPDRETLREAIVRPLARVGYTLEAPEIADRIAADLDGKPGALPLLQFTARRLWAQADQDRKVVTLASFRALGELAGLLAEHASSVITALGPEGRLLAREILVRLVTPERTRAVVPVADLHALGDASPVIEALVGARLVVVDESDTTPMAELVHESLIDRWPTLRSWLDDLDQGDALFAEVSAAARRWAARDRAPGLLWQGESARRLDHFRRNHRGTLTDDEAAFVDAAVTADRRQRRRRRALVIGGFAMLSAMVVGAAVAIVLIRDSATEARASEARATDRQHAADQEAAHAKSAEQRLAEQLSALQREQRERAAAEQRASSTTHQLTQTYDELQKALAVSQRETERVKQASTAAAAAADRERALRAQTEKLLGEREAELQRARAAQKSITTNLKGVENP